MSGIDFSSLSEPWVDISALADHFCMPKKVVHNMILNDISNPRDIVFHVRSKPNDGMVVQASAESASKLATNVWGDVREDQDWWDERVGDVMQWAQGFMLLKCVDGVFTWYWRDNDPSEHQPSSADNRSFESGGRGRATQSSGFVYILTNECMPGLVKVGMTTRSPALRADEISSATGVPMPFVVAKYFEFPDAMGRERIFHSQHADLRLPGREFFRMSVEGAIESLMSGEKPLSIGGGLSQ